MKIFYEPVNLNQWDMFRDVSEGHVETVLATSAMEIGDTIILHVGTQNREKESGAYAVGRIVDGPYIRRNHPEEYCNNKLSVNIRIEKVSYTSPYITHEEFTKFHKMYRRVSMIRPEYYGYVAKLLKDRCGYEI